MHTTWPRWTAGSTAHSWLCLLPGRFSRPSEGVAGVDCGRHTCSRTWGFSPPGSAVVAVSGGPALATFMERLPGGPAGTPSAHSPSCLASSLRPTKGVSSSPPGAPLDGPTGLGRGTPGGRAAGGGERLSGAPGPFPSAASPSTFVARQPRSGVRGRVLRSCCARPGRSRGEGAGAAAAVRRPGHATLCSRSSWREGSARGAAEPAGRPARRRRGRSLSGPAPATAASAAGRVWCRPLCR